uniref:Uncharacterized protein n=1 Tax=Oryza barthii TaxID=65489 RepID=A0A0D3FH39_9ORYZ
MKKRKMEVTCMARVRVKTSNLKDGSIMDNGGQNSGSIFRERGFFYSIYPAQDTTVVESVQSQDSLALKLHVVPEALIAPTRQIKRRK